MKAFALCAALLVVVPMMLLNPMGRDAFLGYYAGVLATWAAFVVASRAAARQEAHPSGDPTPSR